jgi:hypothetical protein
MSPCRTPQLFRALSVVPLVRKNTTGQLHHHFIRRGAVALVDHGYDPCADVQRERATVRCDCAFAFSGFCFNFGGVPFHFSLSLVSTFRWVGFFLLLARSSPSLLGEIRFRDNETKLLLFGAPVTSSSWASSHIRSLLLSCLQSITKSDDGMPWYTYENHTGLYMKQPIKSFHGLAPYNSNSLACNSAVRGGAKAGKVKLMTSPSPSLFFLESQK